MPGNKGTQGRHSFGCGNEPAGPRRGRALRRRRPPGCTGGDGAQWIGDSGLDTWDGKGAVPRALHGDPGLEDRSRRPPALNPKGVRRLDEGGVTTEEQWIGRGRPLGKAGPGRHRAQGCGRGVLEDGQLSCPFRQGYVKENGGYGLVCEGRGCPVEGRPGRPTLPGLEVWLNSLSGFDGVNRACLGARAAVGAEFGVDHILVLALADGVDRAFLGACTT